MTHFLTEKFSSYYERRLLDYAHNRLIRPAVKYPAYSGQLITRVTDDIYEIESSKRDGTVYVVNTAACMCTCYAGQTGKVCKHIHYVSKETNCDRVSYRLTDDRELMYIVATGRKPLVGWLDTLHGERSAHTQCNIVNSNATCSAVSNTAETAVLDTAEDEGIVREQCFQKLEKLLQTLKQTVTKTIDHSAGEVMPSLDAAIASIEGIHTPNACISMLHTLGKYCDAQKLRRKRRHLGNIPVQTTAVGRRRKFLRGRQAGEAGRPRSNALLKLNLHSYALPVSRKRAAAPHSLSVAVHANASLGRTHSRK